MPDPGCHYDQVIEINLSEVKSDPELRGMGCAWSLLGHGTLGGSSGVTEWQHVGSPGMLPMSWQSSIFLGVGKESRAGALGPGSLGLLMGQV